MFWLLYQNLIEYVPHTWTEISYNMLKMNEWVGVPLLTLMLQNSHYSLWILCVPTYVTPDHLMWTKWGYQYQSLFMNFSPSQFVIVRWKLNINTSNHFFSYSSIAASTSNTIFFLIFIYWLRWVLVAAHGIFCCGARASV